MVVPTREVGLAMNEVAAETKNPCLPPSDSRPNENRESLHLNREEGSEYLGGQQFFHDRGD